tara:strand:- start:6196 stop:6537 length:342 start_codon:yes stop_codon:yes gene_type:complete
VEAKLLAELFDLGALGLFAAYLIYSNVKTQKRLDEMAQKFVTTTENQEKAHAAAEDVIRTRYDAVIARHEGQRQTVYDDVVKKLDDHTRILASIEASLPSRTPIDPLQTRPDF